MSLIASLADIDIELFGHVFTEVGSWEENYSRTSYSKVIKELQESVEAHKTMVTINPLF